MDADLDLAARQLARMRGMDALYHRRFFADTRFYLLVILGLAVAAVAFHRGFFLVIPFVALVGACQTAFDASYLIFARQYAVRLERYLNQGIGRELLIAHRLEHAYLFPLDETKAVTLRLGAGFSWFGFMTFLYTATGVLAYLVAVALGTPALEDPLGILVYWLVLGGLTVAALLTGWWWFVSGEGERRLRTILDEVFADQESAEPGGSDTQTVAGE